MSEPRRLEMNDPSEPEVGSEGEPHPAELLANLLRAEAEAGRRPFPGPPAGETNLASYSAPVEPRRLEAVPPAARALAAPANETQDPSTMLKTVQSIRNVLPLLQKLLPLLDGNILATLMAMMGPGQQPAPTATRPVDIAPVEGGLAELKAQHQDLRNQLQTQDQAVKKLAEKLEKVHDATEWNSREQEDLIEELRANSRKTNIVAFLAFVLLAASIAMNVVLYLQIRRLVP